MTRTLPAELARRGVQHARINGQELDAMEFLVIDHVERPREN